ncbi:MAG: hypothetical protein AB7E70_04470 [Hyphomicrobiaceae bacterium]
MTLDASPTSVGSLPPGNLLEQLTFDHGPVELLRRFVETADLMIRERGVSVTLTGFDELVAVNRRNRASWAPILPIFDPARGGAAPEDGLALLGRDRDGSVVTAMAARHYLWPATSFAEEARNLRLFHKDPATGKLPGECCEVTSDGASLVSGRIAFVGAGWFRPDFRGRALSGVMSRLTRTCAYLRWRTDFSTCFVAEPLFKARNSTHWNGFRNIDWSVDWIGGERGRMRFAFCWMRPAELISDLGNFLEREQARDVPARRA